MKLSKPKYLSSWSIPIMAGLFSIAAFVIFGEKNIGLTLALMVVSPIAYYFGFKVIPEAGIYRGNWQLLKGTIFVFFYSGLVTISIGFLPLLMQKNAVQILGTFLIYAVPSMYLFVSVAIFLLHKMALSKLKPSAVEQVLGAHQVLIVSSRLPIRETVEATRSKFTSSGRFLVHSESKELNALCLVPTKLIDRTSNITLFFSENSCSLTKVIAISRIQPKSFSLDFGDNLKRIREIEEILSDRDQTEKIPQI